MRLNVHLDEELLARAMTASGQSTKKATIEEALRVLIRRREWAVAPDDTPEPDLDRRKTRAKTPTK